MNHHKNARPTCARRLRDIVIADGNVFEALIERLVELFEPSVASRQALRAPDG